MIEYKYIVLKNGQPYIPQYVNTGMRRAIVTKTKREALDFVWLKIESDPLDANVYTVAELVPCVS